MRAVWGTLVVTLLGVGCYDPALGPCAVACAEGDVCPGALRCLTDGFCHAVGEDPTCMPDATPEPDAAPPGAYVMVGAGSRHTCAITGDGALRCWGLDTRAQVGSVAVQRRTGTPTEVGSAFTRIDGGGTTTCGITARQLWCWGANDAGQAGQPASNPTVTIPTRVDPSGPDDFVELSVGSLHACAIRGLAERRLYCWGDDTNDHLGDGGGDSTGEELREVSGGGTDWLMVSAGADHTCAMRTTGQIYCWGLGTHGELGTDDAASHAVPTEAVAPVDFRAVAVGRNFTCAITTIGELYCWGDNSGHQLGSATPASARVPIQVGSATGWTAVSTLFSGACGIRDGQVLCWGSGSNGEIGDATFTDAIDPTQVLGLTGATFLASGDYHACAIAGGEVSCWGLDGDGQAGTGTFATKYTPTQIGTDEDWAAVAAGDDHTCGIRGGALYCWGQNDSLQLGVATPAQSPTPVRIGTDTGWKAVGVGTRFGCALRDAATDELWCWGSDADGQLGNGALTGNSQAAQITNPGGVITWDLLAVGPHAVCATSGTSRYCWGEGAEGQLGNGGIAEVDVPTVIASETLAWSHLTLGNRFGGGIVGSDLYTWGRDDRGQLGNGAAGTTLVPMTIITNTWSDVTAAYDGNHMCAIANGGGIACWGDNLNGKLGNGDTNAQSVPTATVDVPLPQSYSAVVAGQEHTCAIHVNGIYCWGSDDAAQLGDEALSPYVDQPTLIDALDLASLAAGRSHTCGVATNGALYCWGDNVHGQLGDGTEAHAAPVPIVAP